MFSLSSLNIFNKKTTKEEYLKENVDYKFVVDPSDDSNYAIRIENGNYLGVIIRFKTINIKEVNEGSSSYAQLLFDYDVIQEPEDIIVNKSDFDQYLGKILHSILNTVALSGEYEKEQTQIKKVNENRNHNLTKFDIQ